MSGASLTTGPAGGLERSQNVRGTVFLVERACVFAAFAAEDKDVVWDVTEARNKGTG